MGCGTQGTNHLKKDGHPLCEKDQLGYMWDRETFDKMVSEKRACLACIKELEIEELVAALDALLHTPAGHSTERNIAITQAENTLAKVRKP